MPRRSLGLNRLSVIVALEGSAARGEVASTTSSGTRAVMKIGLLGSFQPFGQATSRLAESW